MNLQLKNWSFINRIHLKSMYRRALCLPVLGFLSSGLSAQNLVPNPSFEDYTNCPDYANQISNASPWKGTNSSSDYHNSCANVNFPSVGVPFGNLDQFPRTGNGVASFYMLNVFGLNYREYIQTPLLTSLNGTTNYHVKFYALLDNRSGFAVNNFGCYFSENSFTTPEFSQGNTVAPYSPQIIIFNNPVVNDITEWTLIEGIFKAAGGENYLTIGNFSDDISCDTLIMGGSMPDIAYYYFDDISVEEITTPFWQYHDTTIYYGDSVLIGPAITGLDIDWYTANMEFISNSPGIYVTPATSRNFIAKETFNGTETTHVVHVTVIGGAGMDENELDGLLVYPNPSQGEIKISGQDLAGVFELTISDLSGKTVYTEKRTFAHSSESFYPRVQKGMYVLMLTNPETGARMQRRVLIQD